MRDIDIAILSVRPSVTYSRSGILWKRLDIIVIVSSPHGSLIILVLRVSIKNLGEIPTGSPLGGTLNTGGV